MEMMELLKALSEGRQSELADKMAMSAEPPPMNPVGQAPQQAAQPQQQPQQAQAPTPTTPPIQPVGQDAQGNVTGPGLAGLPGIMGTQSGQAVVNPEQEKKALQDQLAEVLGSGIMPEATANEVPFPGQAPGGGPSLGSAALAQPFNMTNPNAGGQTQLSLARLLAGTQ